MPHHVVPFPHASLSRAVMPLALLAALVPAMVLAGHELEDRDLSRGAALYAEHCAVCHGADLEGAPDWQKPGEDGIYPAPPHDETGHTWHHSNEQLFDYTRLGGQVLIERMGLTGFTSGMPGFGEVLTDDEIWDVLAYIRSAWPDRIREMQATRNPPHE